MSSDITEQVFEFVCMYIHEHRISPSIREIAQHCHLSPSSVLRHLDKLEARGRLYREMNKARGIFIVEK